MGFVGRIYGVRVIYLHSSLKVIYKAFWVLHAYFSVAFTFAFTFKYTFMDYTLHQHVPDVIFWASGRLNKAATTRGSRRQFTNGIPPVDPYVH